MIHSPAKFGLAFPKIKRRGSSVSPMHRGSPSGNSSPSPTFLKAGMETLPR
jgi:hypothetical protein